MFKDSCITRLTPFSLLEESTALPLNIFPVYIGSGKGILSIDASGMQGLNHGVQDAFGCMPGSGDMYFLRHGMVGDVVSKDNILPYGYFDWCMELDGICINSSNLQQHASVWSRKLYIDESRVVTKMLIDRHVIVEITAWMPYGKVSPVFEVEFTGYDYENKKITEPRNIKFKMGLFLKTRNGVKTYNECNYIGNKVLIKANGHENYEYNIYIGHDCGLNIFFEDDWFGISFDTSVSEGKTGFKCIYGIDENVDVTTLDKIRNESILSWQKYFSRIARVEGLDIEEVFLYNNSHYLLHSGFDYSYGIQIGVPFFFPWCWKASTFWDSHFIMDGLMRSNDREGADKFLGFLYRSMSQEGKPFTWMFMYDGTSTVDNNRDFAPLVMCAHAMTAIKHYEYFRDFEMLKGYIYPICKRVSEYAANNLYFCENGEWFIGAPVSNDVVDEAPTQINETFTALWFLTILKKTLEYAHLLRVSESLDPKISEILENYRIEHNNEEYMHCRGILAENNRGASWVPFLLYPSEAMPFVDMELINKTRSKYTFPKLYMQKQGCFQPWTEFMEASSDLRRGSIKEAYNLRKLGMTHVFGQGYFSEIGPMQQTVGLPPYVSAHGTFLTALLYQFVTTSIWENKIGIFTSMPDIYKDRYLSIKNVVCTNGIIVSANYCEYYITAVLQGKLENASILMPVPRKQVHEDCRVFVNDSSVDFVYESSTGNIRIKLTSDLFENTIVIK